MFADLAARGEGRCLLAHETPGTALDEAAALDPQRLALYLRVLGGDPGAAPVWFRQAVLDRYRGQPGWKVIRTNSAGRVRSPDGWSLDFGIADADRIIHATAADLAQRLPPAERSHWVRHVLTPPVSATFLTMRLGGGSCIDDGELRDWPAAPGAAHDRPLWTREGDCHG